MPPILSFSCPITLSQASRIKAKQDQKAALSQRWRRALPKRTLNTRLREFVRQTQARPFSPRRRGRIHGGVFYRHPRLSPRGKISSGRPCSLRSVSVHRLQAVQTAGSYQAAAGEEEQGAAAGSSPGAGARAPGPGPGPALAAPSLSPPREGVTGIAAGGLRKAG